MVLLPSLLPDILRIKNEIQSGILLCDTPGEGYSHTMLKCSDACPNIIIKNHKHVIIFIN